jgi:hypothetical protein
LVETGIAQLAERPYGEKNTVRVRGPLPVLNQRVAEG